MTDILFTANGASSTVLVSGELTSGMVGLPVRFSFDSDWDGLNIVAVFDGGGQRISVPLLTDMEAVLPWEVIAKANTRLHIGAEGRKSDGSIVIPTVWANAGYIREGAAATDDLGNPPTPSIYDQIMAAIEAGKLQGKPGEDGVSPTVSVTEIEGGHRVTITDENGKQVFDVMDGKDGSDASVNIVDDLDTKDPNAALSANMGAALREKIDTDLLGVQKELQAEIKQRVRTVNGVAPDENGNVVVQGGGNGGGVVVETDPTVPAWAKQPNKPTYTASEVGARPATWMPTAQEVGALPSTYTPPNQTAEQVGADTKGTAAGAVSDHNTNTASHEDIRLLIEGLATRLNALANSTDTDLDQMAELVAYIKNNKSLIDGITTSKVSVADIINNLTTNVANKPLSAAQGVALKALIDAITVPTKLSQLQNDSGYLTDYTETDPTVPAWAKNATKPSYSKSEVGLGNVDNVKQYSASNPPPYPVTSVNGNTGAVSLDAAAVGARPSTWMPSASDVGALPASTTIPTKVSQLANDKGYLTQHQDISGKVDKAGLSLGRHADGLLYVFVDGQPVGDGVELPTGGINGYVTPDNKIIIQGLPDGSYTAAYEYENGNTVNIGALVIDTNVYYTVTNTLTQCTTNNSATKAVQGGSYSATITAKSGYELSSVKVTMGGTDISSTAVSGGTITIASVTGNIVITAVAEIAGPSYTNVLPLSVNADGSDYRGTNGEDGYKVGYRLSKSNGGAETAATGMCCSGFMPAIASDTFRVKNITQHATDAWNMVMFYDSNKNYLTSTTLIIANIAMNVSDGLYRFIPNAFAGTENVAFIRICAGVISGDTIITRNEDIA